MSFPAIETNAMQVRKQKAIEAFKTWTLANRTFDNGRDPLENWHSIAIGFFVGQGFSTQDADELANHVFWKLKLWTQ